MRTRRRFAWWDKLLPPQQCSCLLKKNNVNAMCEQEIELQRLGLADLPGGSATRLVHHNTEFGHPRSFATNSVTTAKYNVVTFLPRFLVEVFSQVAYFYFLVQVRQR